VLTIIPPKKQGFDMKKMAIATTLALMLTSTLMAEPNLQKKP
jgi:hypothetical protein